MLLQSHSSLSLFFSLLRELDFSEADVFLLEYKLTSPQFTSAHLLPLRRVLSF